LAVDPPHLDGAITDQAGVLTVDRAEIEAVLETLLKEHGVQLFVLFVDTTDGMPSTDFVDETARINSLGADDALLLVAVDDRTDAIWVSDALPITDAEISDVIAGTLEPRLRDSDFGGAVIDTAAALGVAAEPDPEPKPTIPGGGPVEEPPGGGVTEPTGPGVGTFVGIVLLGAGIVIVALWLASRLSRWREAEERDRRTGRLAREANAQLIANDDRIRTSAQEAGFVEAEFGPEEAAPFQAAVSEARDELRGAFEIRQRLDDSEPEDPPTRELMLKDIVERTGRAAAALDRQAARIDELRNLERQAPAILAALPAQVDALEARLPEASTILDSLTASYAEPAWAAVKGNLAEARKGVAGARAAIERGTASVAAGRPAHAAREIVTAQQGIAGAAALLDGITTAARTIQDAEAALTGELEATAADLAAARAADPAERPDGTPGHATDFEKADLALASARTAAARTPPDPVAAGREVAAARRNAIELLAAVRQDAEQQRRFAAALEASISAARAQVDRAGSFIGTRSGGVRRRARTRLAEAERLLDHAESIRETEPAAAMAEAKRADQLAGEAYSLAAVDFAGWDRTGRGTSSGNDVAGAILGGIIGGILSGGGRGAGWGGSSWGSPGSSSGPPSFPGSGGGGWGGGGGHSVGGGFGGFGGGGGGGSGGGGGGGHSGGGRW
jgi:uncharacterized membrane protein YgcG